MTVTPSNVVHHGLTARLRVGSVAAWLPRSIPGVAAEWAWPLGVSLLVLVLVELPFRIAAGQSASGHQFGGMLWSLNDASQYASAMRQGAESSGWLIYDQFSQETHRPALLYPLYVGLGKLASMLGVGLDQAFLAASFVGRLALLLAAYAVTRLLSPDRTMRRTGFMLIVLSSGLGSLLQIAQAATGLDLPVAAVEREHPELNTFLMLFTAPHLLFGLALVLVAARLYAGCWRSRRGWRQVWLAAVVVLIGLTNPFALGSLIAMVGAHGLVMAGLRRRIDWSGHGAGVVVGLVGLPLVAVNALTFLLDPFWSATYGVQNMQIAPPLLDLLLAFGLLVPLALAGVPRLARGASPERLVILVWIVTALVVMYLVPIGTQRRFALGLHPMLALAATGSLLVVMNWLRSWQGLSLRCVRVLVLALLAQALVGTSVFTYGVAAMVALGPNLGYTALEMALADRAPYQPASVQAAAAWLAEHQAADEVVLGSTATSNYLAGAAPGRVYVGHWVATLDFERKQERMGWFYAGLLDDERRTFLSSNDIRYVVYGPHERLLHSALTPPAGVQPAFSAPGIDVYDVRALAAQHETGRATPAPLRRLEGPPSLPWAGPR